MEKFDKFWEVALVGLFDILEAQGRASREGGQEVIGVCKSASSFPITVSGTKHKITPAPRKATRIPNLSAILFLNASKKSEGSPPLEYEKFELGVDL